MCHSGVGFWQWEELYVCGDWNHQSYLCTFPKTALKISVLKEKIKSMLCPGHQVKKVFEGRISHGVKSASYVKQELTTGLSNRKSRMTVSEAWWWVCSTESEEKNVGQQLQATLQRSVRRAMEAGKAEEGLWLLFVLQRLRSESTWCAIMCSSAAWDALIKHH